MDLFDHKHVFIETLCLLASSVTCGFGSMAIFRNDARAMYFWMGITFLLGVCFLTIEGREFASMMAVGAGPSHSAFLSAFFTLVGTHGLHVSVGLIWLIVMLVQVTTLGFRPMVTRQVSTLTSSTMHAATGSDWDTPSRLPSHRSGPPPPHSCTRQPCRYCSRRWRSLRWGCTWRSFSTSRARPIRRITSWHWHSVCLFRA